MFKFLIGSRNRLKTARDLLEECSRIEKICDILEKIRSNYLIKSEESKAINVAVEAIGSQLFQKTNKEYLEFMRKRKIRKSLK